MGSEIKGWGLENRGQARPWSCEKQEESWSKSHSGSNSFITNPALWTFCKMSYLWNAGGGETEERLAWPLRHLPAQSRCCTKEEIYKIKQFPKQMSKALCSQESLEITRSILPTKKQPQEYTSFARKKKIATRIIHACTVPVSYAPRNYKLILRRMQGEVTRAIPKWQASFFQEKEGLPLYIKHLTKIFLHPYQTHWHLKLAGNLKVSWFDCPVGT